MKDDKGIALAAIAGGVIAAGLVFLSALLLNLGWDIFTLDELVGANPTYVQWLGIILFWGAFVGTIKASSE